MNLDIERGKEMLENTASALESLGIKYWIDSGTLLAAYRDKNLNPFDHDLDIRCLPGEVTDSNIGDLVKAFWDIGYTIAVQNKGKRAQMLLGTPDHKVLLDLKFAFQDENLLWVYCWASTLGDEEPTVHAYPRRFFEKMDEIELLGRKYPTPSPIVEYLEYHYGKEWQLFKKDISQADETDLTWDSLKSPPCAMSLKQLVERREQCAAAHK